MSKDNSTNGAVQRRGPPPDPKTPIARTKLPDELQKLVDNEESLIDQLYDGTANPSTDSNVRYAAYASRLRTILLSAHRYVAYTSDIGESLRSIAHPWLVRGAYGISWAYLLGDVSHEGYKAYLRNQRVVHPGVPGVVAESATDATVHTKSSPGKIEGPRPGHVLAIEDYRSVMLQRAVFQSVASMGLPAFTIHSIVKYSGRALKDAKNMRIRTYGPIGLGLAAVPFLPYIFDKPVEEAVEWSFYHAFRAFGGPSAVGHRPETGREQLLQVERKTGVIKDKEL
ncbi:MAG: hypothetical protein Q9187_005004 [Circinaria calcarea]